MITDKQIADYLVQLYTGPNGFDFYRPSEQDSGVCWASKSFGDYNLVLLRGSKTLQDWIRDLLAVTLPYQHATLGPLHPGFSQGMYNCWLDIKANVKPPYVISGHSLGAARASILTGLMMEDGVKPLAKVVFGEPKPGFKQLANYISSVPTRSYRNTNGKEHDYVTDVPLTLLLEQYVHPSTMIDLSVTPVDSGLFRFHHMPLYAGAL